MHGDIRRSVSRLADHRGVAAHGTNHRFRPMVLAALLSACAMLALAVSVPRAHADSGGTIQIVVPVGSGGSFGGPVGTNVTVQASGLSPATAYQLGLALSSAGCSGGFQPLSVKATTDQSGGFLQTFGWPSFANQTGSSYQICTEDSSGTVTAQSQNLFTVESASRPEISIAPAAQPSATVTATPDTYYANGEITITGNNFLPGGQTLVAYISPVKITQAADIQVAQVLSTVGAPNITADASGHFTATVTLIPPSAPALPAQFYVYVMSQDGQANILPSLMASKSITLHPAPQPTPTFTAAPAVTPTVSTGKPRNTGNSGNLAAIIALGGLSAVLFIMGVVLLASAAAMPRSPN